MGETSYKIGKVIAFCLFRIIPRCQVVGRENLPSKGPLIIVGNHPSHLEPVLGAKVFPWPAKKPLKRIPKKLSREASSQIIRKIAELLPEEKRGRCYRGGKNG